MKKWLLFVFIVLNASFLFAQKAVILNPVKDTVKSKFGKIKIVDGTAMTSADDIIENISKLKEYTVLVNAIEDAGLTQTFKSKGPITIFAPTNKAFEKLPSGELDTLLKSAHKYDLSYLLTYHAIAGRLSAREIEKMINSNKGQATLTTIAGIKLTAKIDANRNIVLMDETGGESVISRFDIPQSNGILHMVTAVLVPKTKVI